MLRTRAAAAIVASALLVTGGSAIAQPRVPHVLVYDQTLGFHHQSIEHAEVALGKIARLDAPFTLTITQDPKALTKKTLSKTAVVMWLSNTAGTGRASPFTDAQEKAYESWMLCGGGHVGVHAAVDSYNDEAFPAYVNANGAIFTAHPITVTSAADDQDHDNEGWGEPKHTLNVLDQRSLITQPWHGSRTFQINEELYQLDRDPASVVSDFHLLLSHESVDDPQGMIVSQFTPYAENAPIAWTGSYKHRNRTFYTNLGHSVMSWKSADFLRHLVNGVLWTTGKKIDRSCLRRAGF